MQAVLATVITLLTQISGVTSEVSVIGNIISWLAQIVPLLVKEYNDLVQPVKNIIAALSANSATTADQLTTLQQLDAKVDADFEAAAAAAQAEDNQ